MFKVYPGNYNIEIQTVFIHTQERRPSLVLGDSVILIDPRNPDGPVYEGCIEDVRKSDLILRKIWHHHCCNRRNRGVYLTVGGY